MSRRWALIAVIVSAACFGTLAVLAPLAYASGARPLPLLAWRFAIAASLLAVVVTAVDRRGMIVPLADVGRFAVLALIGYGASSLCFFYALIYADAAVVAVLLYAYPALVTLAGWLTGSERLTPRAAAAIGLTFLGCALVAGLGSGSMRASWQGVVLGLGAAVAYALYSLLSHRWLLGRSRLTMMAYMFGLAAILPATAAVLGGGPSALSVAGWTGTTWFVLALIIALPTFAAVVLYLGGIRGLGASQAAIVSTFEPVFTIFLARAFLPEQAALTPLQIAGVVLVLGGVVFSESGSVAAEPAGL